MTKLLTLWLVKLVAWLSLLAGFLWAAEKLIRHWHGAWLGYLLLLILIIAVVIIAWLGSVYLAEELNDIVDN